MKSNKLLAKIEKKMKESETCKELLPNHLKSIKINIK